MAFVNYLDLMPGAKDTAQGIADTKAAWLALGSNCQGILRRVKALVNTARSDAGLYANQQFQGYVVFIPNPYYIALDVSDVIRPRYAQPSANDFGGAIKITTPGTYTVNASSLVSGTAAVDIDSSNGDVIIDGGNILSAGNAFTIRGYGRVIIRNVRGWGLPPTVSGATHGKFVSAFRPRKCIVENNVAHKFGTMILMQEPDDTALASDLITRRNLIYDINGRLSNGNYPNEKSNGIQYDGQKSRAGQLIEDNFIQNELADTTVEDNLNVHNSSGTAASLFTVRNNMVDQGYGPSGSGITTDGDPSKQADPATAAAFVEAYGNTFLGIRNGSLNNSGGHDVYYHDNVAICANLLPDGTPRPPGTYGYNSGLSISNSTNAPAAAFYNNRMENNLLCINHQYYHLTSDKRHDLATPVYGGQEYRNNTIPIGANSYLKGDLPDNTASRAMETLWKNIHLQKWAQRNIKIGPLGQWR